jgi:hypothetical protein
MLSNMSYSKDTISVTDKVQMHLIKLPNTNCALGAWEGKLSVRYRTKLHTLLHLHQATQSVFLYSLCCEPVHNIRVKPQTRLIAGWITAFLACIKNDDQTVGENQETQAKPQQIVTKTLLSCVQYLVPYLSHLQKI